jgi:hypothetical protein
MATIVHTRTAPTSRPRHPLWTMMVAVLIGAVFGPASWYAHDHLTGLPRLLGDSAAAWLAVAFVAGWTARSVWSGALAGLLALGGSVLSYYAVQRGYGVWVESDGAVQYWKFLAAVTGPVLGGLGAAARTASPPVRGFALAAIGAAGLAEALHGYRSGVGDHPLYLWEAAVAVLVPVALARHWRAALATLGWLPVLTMLALPVLTVLLHAQHTDPASLVAAAG